MEAEGRRSLGYPRRDQSVRGAGTPLTSLCARPRTAPLVPRIQHGFLQCSRRSAQGRPRRPSSSGRASAAIAPIHPSGDVIVLDQPAFAGGGAPLLDLRAEPLVVLHRAGQQVERHLIGRTATLCGRACPLRFELGRDLQVHKIQRRSFEKLVNVAVSGIRTSRSVFTRNSARDADLPRR